MKNTPAAALARRRWAKRDIEKTCPFCEQPFKGVREQVYCTPKHQQAAAAQRLRDKRRAAQPAPIRVAVNGPPGLAPLLRKAEECRLAGDLAGAARWQQHADELVEAAERGSVE